MDTFSVITQMIGYIGLIFSIIAFQCKAHDKIMRFKTANELIFAFQYALLGAYTGCAMNLVGSTRNLLFAYRVKKDKSNFAFQILFSVAFAVFGALTWQGPISIMIIAAKIGTTVAYGIKNTRVIRCITLPTSICWLIYNLVSSSYAGAIGEALTIASIVTAMIRIDIVGTLKNRAKDGD